MDWSYVQTGSVPLVGGSHCLSFTLQCRWKSHLTNVLHATNTTYHLSFAGQHEHGPLTGLIESPWTGWLGSLGQVLARVSAPSGLPLFPFPRSPLHTAQKKIKKRDIVSKQERCLRSTQVLAASYLSKTVLVSLRFLRHYFNPKDPGKWGQDPSETHQEAKPITTLLHDTSWLRGQMNFLSITLLLLLRLRLAWHAHTTFMFVLTSFNIPSSAPSLCRNSQILSHAVL